MVATRRQKFWKFRKLYFTPVRTALTCKVVLLVFQYLATVLFAEKEGVHELVPGNNLGFHSRFFAFCVEIFKANLFFPLNLRCPITVFAAADYSGRLFNTRIAYRHCLSCKVARCTEGNGRNASAILTGGE